MLMIIGAVVVVTVQWNTTDKTLIHGVDVGINVDPKNMLHYI